MEHTTRQFKAYVYTSSAAEVNPVSQLDTWEGLTSQCDRT